MTMTWQPIETAPKDGDGLILTNGYIVCCGYWEDDIQTWLYHEYPDSYNAYRIYATHWMPLPEKPTI